MENKRGQSALEYMLLLGLAMVVALIGYRELLPRTQSASNLFFNHVTLGIAGAPSHCGDGIGSVEENAKSCCVDFVNSDTPKDGSGSDYRDSCLDQNTE